jgi:hypothetical protein
MTYFAWPVWAAWALVVLATAGAVAAFLIPPRRLREPVASLDSWRRALDAPNHASLWGRVRRAVSLVLAAAIAAAIAIALSNPFASSRRPDARPLLIVIDSSWTMAARTSPGRTRWTTAIERASALAVGVVDREVALATTAEGIIAGPTRDAAALTRILRRLTPSGVSDGAWPRLAGGGDVDFITDGAVPRALAPEIRVESVFTQAPNVAVTAFDVQPIAVPAPHAEAYLAVANHAPAAQTVQVTVTRGADVLLSRSIHLGAGATFRGTLPVDADGDPRFRVHVSAPDNALEIDDDAATWLWAAQPLHVGIVGPGSLVPAMMAHDGALRVSTVEPLAYASATADVWVFDRWLPPAAPSAPALLIEPPGSSWLGAIVRAESDPLWRPGDAHPLLDGVDTEFVQLRKAIAFERPGLRPIASTQNGTPLISVEEGRQRLVVLGFSTADSNIASLPALPMLVANAVDWLGRPDRGARRTPGPVALPVDTTGVTSPTGQSMTIGRSGGLVTTTLTSPGLYRIDGPGGPRVIAVGLDDPPRSNLQVSSVPPAKPDAAPASAPKSSWPVIATWGALALVVVEWLTWLRRVTV